MQIRELAHSDLPALLHLYKHLHDAHEPLPEPRRIEAVWHEIQANWGIRYFGAFVESQLVSSCTLAVIPNLTRGGRPYGVIENVVTQAEHRACGFGKAVLAEALSAAWSQGCYKVMLMTGRKDEATFQFYESAGFDRQARQAFIAKPSWL